MRATIRTMGVTVVTLVLAVPLAGQPTLLHLEPAEDQVSRYVTAFEVSMAGMVIEATQQYHTETVVAAAAGVIETHMVIDSTAVTITGLTDRLLSDLSGMSYTVMHDTRARPWGVTDAGTLTPEAAEFAEFMLRAGYWELPGGSVSPGDAWTGEASTGFPGGGGLASEVTYTFVGIEGDLAEISIDGRVNLSGNAGMEGSGTVKGTAIFDTGDSRLHGLDIVLDLNLMSDAMSIPLLWKTTRELLP